METTENNHPQQQVQPVIIDARASVEPVIIAGDFNSYGIGEEFVKAGFTWVTRDVGPTLLSPA